MSRKQKIIILLLGIADLIVIGGLAATMLLGPSLITEATAPDSQPSASIPTEAHAPTLYPTWTPTPSPTPRPTATRFPTATPISTGTPGDFSAFTPIPSPTPTPSEDEEETRLLENGDFEEILPDSVPGWEVSALVTWQPGEEFNSDSSYGRPEFSRTGDPRREITDSTLMVTTYQWVKFSVVFFQAIEVEPGSQVQFSIRARGYSENGGVQLRAGLNPGGGGVCQGEAWGETVVTDQYSGMASLVSPEGIAGERGVVTVCFFAEPQYAAEHSAAFFDDAELTVVASAE